MFYFRRVVGKSMEPTLAEGRILLISRARNFKKGDVVVAFMDGREVVKRITGHEDGQVYLEGDNGVASTDSNTHGWLVDRLVVGKVIFPVTKLK